MRWNGFDWSRVDLIVVCRHRFQGMHSQFQIGFIQLICLTVIGYPIRGTRMSPE